MGCICSKKQKKQSLEITEASTPKTYSWDNKKNQLDLKNFIVENTNGQEIIKYPGTINGEQFLVNSCTDSSIYIFDLINTVTVEDCQNCSIVLGPVVSSVYLRNCVGCIVATVCGQFRTRDCRKCHAYVHCASQPIIETSTGMKFGTYELNYKGLEDHITQSGLNLSINTWSEVYDFTPVLSDTNWCFTDTDFTKTVLKSRSKGMERALSELNATWLGKPAFHIGVESTV